MNTLFSIGVNRIFYKAESFAIGKIVTAYLWNPSMVRSVLQTFTEIELGLYYLDYNFSGAGVYIGLFHENDVSKTFSTFRVKDIEGAVLDELLADHVIAGSLSKKISEIASSGVGTGPTGKTYTLTVNDAPCADVLVIMSTDILGANPIHHGRTDALGQIIFYPDLPAETTVYLWRYKTGVSFVNPDVEEI